MALSLLVVLRHRDACTHNAPPTPPVGDRRAGRGVGHKEGHTRTLGNSGLGISLRGQEQTCYRDSNADDAGKVRKHSIIHLIRMVCRYPSLF